MITKNRLGTTHHILQLARKHTRQDDGVESDVAHDVALRLAAAVLPPGYVREARRQRMDVHQADAPARELVEAARAGVMEEVAEEAGGLDLARELYEGNALDGIRFARIRGLVAHGDIEAYRRGNPSFRQRYDTDVAFHHGVLAGVWGNAMGGPP
jgi:hypothetical protein